MKQSGFAVYVLWFVILVSFYSLAQSAFNFNTTIAAGIPQPLAVLRLVLLTSFFGSLLAILFQQQWGLWTLFATVIGRIPFGVAFNHFYSVENEVGHQLTTGWIVRTTFWNAVFWLLVLWVLLWAIRMNVSAE